jgi:hypothetical protein
MAIPEANINNTGSLAKFLEAIKTAGVPERVTFEFLKTLGFKSSNDRPIITIMKGIGFLDTDGKPTEQYKWIQFEDIFDSQDWVKARFGDMEKSRNVIAHNNVLEDQEIERIRLYLQDWARIAGL